MAACPLPSCDGPRLQKALYDRFRIEVPVTECGGRQYLRVSAQAYNTSDDVNALTAALQVLLPPMSLQNSRAV
jgi:selenocysteine lyase/cysteine desulfurase